MGQLVGRKTVICHHPLQALWLAFTFIFLTVDEDVATVTLPLYPLEMIKIRLWNNSIFNIERLY
jgi:hypothetical protein